MRNHIINVLVWLIIRIANEELIDQLATVWLRGRGHTVMDGAATEVTLAALRYQRQRLRKLGGGNVSKLRDPRKTLMRLARNFELAIESVREGTVDA